MEREPEGTLITLLDEDGNEREFEHLATLKHDGSSYVALVPAFSDPEEMIESDGDLVILKIEEDDDGEDSLVSIDDDDEFDAVAAKFEKMLADDYDIQEIHDDEEAEDDSDDEDNE